MRTKYTRLTLLLLLGLTSCAEKPWEEDIVKKTIDSIEGEYIQTGCTWQGPAVDMDNDGISSTDFWAVFQKYPNTQQSAIHVDSPQNKYEPGAHYHQSFQITCLFPFQCVAYNYDRISPVPQYFGTYYQLQEDQIILSNKLSPIQLDLSYQDIRRMGKTCQLIQTGYAELEIHIDAAIYDFATKTWVNAPLIHHFKRAHY